MLWNLFSWLLTVGFVMAYPVGIQQVISIRQGKSKVLNTYPKLLIAAWFWPVYCLVFAYRSILLAVEDANDMVNGLTFKKVDEKPMDIMEMFWK
jgi:Na+/proline symporter